MRKITLILALSFWFCVSANVLEPQNPPSEVAEVSAEETLVVANDSVNQPEARSEIENRYISKIKNGCEIVSQADTYVIPEQLKPYKETMYVRPGKMYLTPLINRNVYFVYEELITENEECEEDDSGADLGEETTANEELEEDSPENTGSDEEIAQNNEAEEANEPEFTIMPVWDENYAEESLANLFNFNSGGAFPQINLNLRVLKHEYGEVEELTTTVANLLAVAESEGETPFFGIEKVEDGNIYASLFLVNPEKEYSHLLRMKGDIKNIFENAGSLNARVSLYIPTGNINDLLQPSVRKSDNERINYNK